MNSTVYVGIDVGKNGGVCYLVPNDTTTLYEAYSFKCPSTPRDMAKLLTTPPILPTPPKDSTMCLLERVHSMPKQGVKSMFTFGCGYGLWQGILATIPISYDLVTPSVWMKHYGAMPKEKKDRKNHIKAIAQRLYPEAYITLATSDAILIAHYLMMSNRHDQHSADSTQ